jgi:hypothetical protein
MKLLAAIFLLIPHVGQNQTIGSNLPKQIHPSGEYMFYLHGGVVTVLGNNAINQSVPEWGPYEYHNILDSLKSRGFHLISEKRSEGVEDVFYANKISIQIDSLLRRGVDAKNILVLGASAGWSIALRVSDQLQNKQLKFVLMGGCWPDSYKDYEHLALAGSFLSIIEASDPHGTCSRIFEHRSTITSYKEVTLNTGRSHGFIYKGYKDWIDPVVAWFKQNR